MEQDTKRMLVVERSRLEAIAILANATLRATEGTLRVQLDAAKKVLHENEKAVHEHRDSEDLVAWMALHSASGYWHLGELTKCAAEALLLARQTSEQLAAITQGQAAAEHETFDGPRRPLGCGSRDAVAAVRLALTAALGAASSACDSVSRATRQVASATGSLPSSGTALHNGNEKGPATTQASGFRDTAHRAGHVIEGRTSE